MAADTAVWCGSAQDTADRQEGPDFMNLKGNFRKMSDLMDVTGVILDLIPYGYIIFLGEMSLAINQNKELEIKFDSTPDSVSTKHCIPGPFASRLKRKKITK